MANQKTKKKKRSRINAAANRRDYSSLYQSSTVSADEASAIAEIGGRIRKGSESVDWSGDYAYVLHDLRVLTVVSILIFAAMIGAGFFF